MTTASYNSSSSIDFKWIRQIGLFLFLAEFFLAAYLYLERVSFVDVAFQTFELVRTGGFPTQVYRFGSMLTHFYPWLALKMGLTLKYVALFYSVGVVFYNILIFVYLAYIKKSYRWSLVFVLYSSMLITHMFFWIQSEYSQAIPFLILMLAYLEDLPFSIHHAFKWVLSLILIVTAIFFHPLIIVLFTLVLTILVFSEHIQKSVKLTYSIAWVLALVVYLIKRFYFDNYYDHEAQERVQNFVTLFPNYFSTMSTNLFFRNSYTLYIGGWISMATLLWIWIRQRRWKQLLFGSILVMAYFFFINVTHPVADLFYLENMYLGIPLIIGMLFVFWTKDEPNHLFLRMKPLILLAACLSVLCIVRLVWVSGEYQKRLTWHRTIIDKFKDRKVILSEKDVPLELIKLSWASPYEFWLVSTIDANRSASIVITNNPNHYLEQGQHTNVFVSLLQYSYDSLPGRYCKFTDTVSKYTFDKILP